MSVVQWQVTVPSVLFGPGSIMQTASLLSSQNITRPLLVTDPGVLSQSFAQALIAQLKDHAFNVTVFSDIKGNPTKQNVESGLAYFKEKSCDGIVALGGGSAIDVAKAISLVAFNQNDLWLYCYFENPQHLPLVEGDNFFVPFMVIPTTAGTGSELSGSSCVINDETSQRKRVAYHPEHFPFAVIDDPQLLMGLPINLSAWTGMDALTHAIEALCAPDYHPLCDGIALESIRLCHEYLALSVGEPHNIEAKTQMMAASSIAAVAFTSKGLGAVHSIAHALGALLDIHHGLANAVVLPYVLRFNLTAIAPKLTRLACLLDLSNRTAEGFLEWINELRDQLAIPKTLHAIDVTHEQLADIALLAVKDTEHHTNPITMDKAKFMSILTAAYQGVE
ncbi:iron-containing alcohol dehydrogenase [uncultured Paraglaciecola sp.]|uniref:iron-containing alcohol dehydrogenase n=1 Tax=uncultured Paraglaciecola sp. TaxID=1765024 RepID=UPI0030D77BB5|tara:strand:+ start:403105 stop:404280 length:1176 start_codon:yes stop_codon:yes gene_type:complete